MFVLLIYMLPMLEALKLNCHSSWLFSSVAHTYSCVYFRDIYCVEGVTSRNNTAHMSLCLHPLIKKNLI